MLQIRALALTLGLGVLTATSPARAEGLDDFSLALKDATGSYYPSYVLTKLHTFKLGAKCWAKVSGKDSGAVHTASFVTRDITEYAKKLTKDDWSDIESQNNSDRENNKKLVEPMVEAFKARLMINITVEGDDCDNKQAALWLRYWSSAVTALTKYPLPQEKVVINLVVSSKAREVTNVRSKDGTTFTITAPKDIEAKGDVEAIERPFRQINNGFTDDFAFSVKEATGDYNAGWVISKFHTFKVGKKCLPKLGAPQGRPVHAGTFVRGDIEAYAKQVGADDWDEIEGQSANDPETNRAIVSKGMDEFGKSFHITVVIEGDDCDTEFNSLWIKYWSQIASALNDYPPKAKKVAVTLTVTSKAKDVTVKVGKDGSTIAVTAPKDKEPTAWDSKIDDPLKKVSRKK